MVSGSGSLTPGEERKNLVELFQEGLRKGARAKAIADLIGLCSRTLRRWGIAIDAQGFSQDGRKGSIRMVPHRFSEEERQQVLATINDPEYADLTPAQIVARLAEQKVFIGSESTIYRIMRQEGLLNHRGRSRPPRPPQEPPVLEATGIKQVLAWDITLLPGPVKGQFYYLYMAMDVWSRRIIGAEVHECETGELAKNFFDRICRDEGITRQDATVLHADNGAPMRSYTLAAKMNELGVSLSFSRPRVSNDNAFAESVFRTMKYHQSYPSRRFRDLPSVRAWVESFVDWYNNEHRHSGIKYVTPNQRHYGEADEICHIRQETYEKARQKNPRRWTRTTRDWSQPQVVRVNHPRPQQHEGKKAQKPRPQGDELDPPARGGASSSPARGPAA